MGLEIGKIKIGESYTREQIEGAGMELTGFEERTEGDVKENIENYREGSIVYVFRSNNGSFELLEKRDAHSSLEVY